MMKLDATAIAAGVRLIAHDVLESTNAHALTLAQRGERGPLWITAQRQTAGRGRRGRTWVSQPGNLYATLLLASPGRPQCWPQLSLVAGLALHDALIEIAPSLTRRVAIKWPNDLLLDDAKFAGILIEGEGGKEAIAIGIGVNCASHPAKSHYPATDLASAGMAIAPEMLFAPLSRKMLGRLAQWNGGEGFTTIRCDWSARANGLGEEIRVRLADRELMGRFEALDDDGALVLRVADGGAVTVTAGELVRVRSSRA
jgi:BirA family transcriptional regulator, biotin operon repressor / biotin---[acetyl-CoA-carboxylase] ligase